MLRAIIFIKSRHRACIPTKQLLCPRLLGQHSGISQRTHIVYLLLYV
jgi:hypothetical protein